MACYGILGERDIAIDDNMFSRTMLSRKYSVVGGVKKAKKEETIFVDVEDMLELMRGYACELCGTEFRFSDIYDAYYSGKGSI